MAEAFASLAAQQELTSKELREFKDSMSAFRESSDRTVTNLTESTQALRESTQRMGEHLGGIANNQGSVTEEFFYNSLLEHPQVGAFKFSKIISNHMVGSKGKQTEFDLVLVNGDSVVVVEIKYKLHPAHIDKLAAQLKAFKKLSPEFKAYRLYGALAGFSVPGAVQQAAAEHGYMVLQRKGQAITCHAEGLRAQ